MYHITKKNIGNKQKVLQVSHIFFSLLNLSVSPFLHFFYFYYRPKVGPLGINEDILLLSHR